MHLAHPLGVKGFRYRRVKNDVRDAGDLADLLRMGRLPESWIAPPATRELRELVRYRAKLVAIRSGLKAQVHAVLAKAGVLISVSDLFGATGRQRLAKVPLAAAYAERVRSLLELIDILDGHEARFAALIAERLDTHRGYQAIQQVPGIGPVLAAVFVAEIGDVGRFTGPAQLCSWAGLTPRHRESDTVVHRGHITKQGSKLVRWAAIEAVQRHPTTAKIAADKDRIEARRGKNIAKGAAAQPRFHRPATGNQGCRRHHLHQNMAGLVVMASLIDCATREVIGYAMAEHLRTELVLDAVEMAMRNGRLHADCIMHSEPRHAIHVDRIPGKIGRARVAAFGRADRSMLG